jgi:ubiquitin C-terminal hydrolase
MSSIYGIQNLGNTCYINVNIQLILNCKELNKLILNSKNFLQKNDLLYSYICILKRLNEIKEEEKLEINENDDTVYIRKLRLSSFIEKFRKIFSQVSFNQQDCLEGLTFILNNFHETLSKHNKNNDYKLILENVRYNKYIFNDCVKQFEYDITKDHSLLFNIFYSYYLNQIKCKNCNNVNNKIEQYKEICLNLHEDKMNNNLDKMLNNYFTEEILDGYRCDKCNKKDSFKKCILLNTPKYLVIQLKRFQYSMKTNNFIKISNEVNYPLFLDMNKYCLKDNINTNIDNNIYELTNIINHLGNSLDSGHYTSHHKINDKWFYADDDDIIKIKENDVFVNKCKIISYVLIYEKKLTN